MKKKDYPDYQSAYYDVSNYAWKLRKAIEPLVNIVDIHARAQYPPVHPAMAEPWPLSERIAAIRDGERYPNYLLTETAFHDENGNGRLGIVVGMEYDWLGKVHTVVQMLCSNDRIVNVPIENIDTPEDVLEFILELYPKRFSQYPGMVPEKDTPEWVRYQSSSQYAWAVFKNVQKIHRTYKRMNRATVQDIAQIFRDYADKETILNQQTSKDSLISVGFNTPYNDKYIYETAYIKRVSFDKEGDAEGADPEENITVNGRPLSEVREKYKVILFLLKNLQHFIDYENSLY